MIIMVIIIITLALLCCSVDVPLKSFFVCNCHFQVCSWNAHF